MIHTLLALCIAQEKIAHFFMINNYDEIEINDLLKFISQEM